jgi:hypothetical protein
VAVVGEYGHVAGCDEPHDRGDGRRHRDYGHVAASSSSVAPVYWLMAAFYCLMKKDDWQSSAVLGVPSSEWSLRILGYVRRFLLKLSPSALHWQSAGKHP